jgi:hypothetical protein
MLRQTFAWLATTLAGTRKYPLLSASIARAVREALKNDSILMPSVGN